MSAIDLTEKIRELKSLQRLIEEAEAEAETIKDSIKAEMTARDVEEMVIDVFNVRWTTVTSSRFDSTAFKKTHEELYTQYSKPSVTRRFSVA